ncbi:hypothetical protein SD37_14280 [Amycolatopsis orientalis]|uniref:TIGR04222 domain-containing membrane protein n=1 Tax=Amycolatopsis orientalis TaxID=31958 RepID=A0A193BWV0_AMYOR|nr:TIGR04222 domain-containing membrane protein [Amycolatopsis orientalis]ANN16711.1 hypothetical protein SD37_14280 [Amycolatopsis orientalis]
MNEPWGISGPAFAWLYGCLVVLPLALAELHARWLRRDTGAREVPGVHHLAALAGGSDRVTDTSVAGLLERSGIRLDSHGVLYPTKPVPADPFERAVVSTLPSLGIGLRELRSKMARHEVVLELRADLQRRGLQVGEKRRRVGWQCAMAAYVPIFALGVARLANAVPLRRPSDILIMLLLAVLGAIALAGGLQWPDRAGRATTAGMLALHYGQWDRSLGRTTTGRVALHGLGAFPEPVFAATLVRTGGSRQSRSAAGGASGCAQAVSSCGGGDGGGGGCGG